MTDTYVEPTSLEEYLSAPVESPSDAMQAEDLQASDQPLDDDQSSEDGDGVATETDPEQPETPETPEGKEAPASQDAPETPAAPDWNSPENPYLKDAETLKQIRDGVERQQAEQAAQQERERLIEAGKRIVEVDESDIPELMGDFIDEIRETATQPIVAQFNSLHRDMTALVAALQALPAEQQEAVKQGAAHYRTIGQSANDIELALTVSQREREAASRREAELQTKVRSLTAQLAAKQIKESGKNRHETVAVGGSGNADPESWSELLGGPGGLGR